MRTIFHHLPAILLVTTACSSEDAASGRAATSRPDSGEGGTVAPAASTWRTVFSDLPGALFSVWGKSESDVWVVGSDAKDGHGPLVLHYDGARWLRKTAASSGDLWWVHGLDSGPVYMGGSNGTILRFDGASFTRVSAPRTKGTVFGIWAAGGDVWAVGGDVVYGTGAFVWRLSGSSFVDFGQLPVPAADVIAYFKVWGTAANDVWVVGTPGLTMHFDGSRFERVDPSVADPLFTVHASAAQHLYAAVGGADLGVLLERAEKTPWAAVTVPDGTRTLFGVWLTARGGYAVGDEATVLTRVSGTWTRERTGLATTKGFHSVWVDGASGVWAAGGDILSPPYGAGILIHKGKQIPTSFVLEPVGPSDASIERAEAAADAASVDAGPSASEAGDARVDAAVDATRDRDGSGEGSIDASVRDARAESGPPPKTVACGAATCTLPLEICCADPNTGVPVGCSAAGAPCPGGGAPVSCDEPSDCTPGFACCLNREAQVGPLQNVECEPACFGPSVCKTTAECGGDPCNVFSIMPSYRICVPP